MGGVNLAARSPLELVTKPGISTIISNLTSCINIHTACGSRLGGVSLEFTSELNDEGFSVTDASVGA